MSYSYEKQIERLLKFVNRVQTLADCHCYKTVDPTCLWHQAQVLLNDEPVRLNTTTYGLLENPRRQKAPERKYNYPRYF
jgi:hypothetical protein